MGIWVGIGSQYRLVVAKGAKLEQGEGSFRLECKNGGSMPQQIWQERNLSLLKSRKCRAQA